MHILITILSAITTILVLLNRLAEAGIDLGGLNPFLWSRRRKWKKQYQGNPLWQIEQPMDATAILLVAVAKADGDMTKEDKSALLNMFETEFRLSKKDAAGLLVSSVHVLGDGDELRRNVAKFLSPNVTAFSPEQASSAFKLLEKIAGPPGSRHPNAEKLLVDVDTQLGPDRETSSTW